MYSSTFSSLESWTPKGYILCELDGELGVKGWRYVWQYLIEDTSDTEDDGA